MENNDDYSYLIEYVEEFLSRACYEIRDPYMLRFTIMNVLEPYIWLQNHDHEFIECIHHSFIQFDRSDVFNKQKRVVWNDLNVTHTLPDLVLQYEDMSYVIKKGAFKCFLLLAHPDDFCFHRMEDFFVHMQISSAKKLFHHPEWIFHDDDHLVFLMHVWAKCFEEHQVTKHKPTEFCQTVEYFMRYTSNKMLCLQAFVENKYVINLMHCFVSADVQRLLQNLDFIAYAFKHVFWQDVLLWVPIVENIQPGRAIQHFQTVVIEKLLYIIKIMHNYLPKEIIKTELLPFFSHFSQKIHQLEEVL